MKKYLFLLVVLTSLSLYSQISFGPKHIGKSSKFKKGILEKFKQTTTIFVLSDIYNEQAYKAILDKSWTVTPYKIVSHKNFNPFDYKEGNFSFAEVSGYKITKTTKMGSIVHKLYTFVDFYMYHFDEIEKGLSKLSEKKAKKKMTGILFSNRDRIARFYLFPDSDFVNTALNKKMDEISTSMLSEDIFFNYKLGMLKNYLQKINNLITDEKIYWIYKENEFSEELKNLTREVLYIPEYVGMKTDAFTSAIENREENEIIKLFNNYEYKYEFVDNSVLNDKILNGEEIYYLRYVRHNAEKFIDIVNSQTGEVIYRNYVTGLSYNIKPKHLKELNKTISKSIKKG